MPGTLSLNAQGELTFKLVNTNLVALYRKDGDNNTFLIMPTDKEPSGGMTIKAMVDDVNKLLTGYDPDSPTLNAQDVANSVKDVNDASDAKTPAPQGDGQKKEINYLAINVKLRQAFLFLSTGQPVEYAFELDVDLSELFPADISIFNVRKLSVSVWNTDRRKILDRMDIIDFNERLGVVEN